MNRTPSNETRVESAGRCRRRSLARQVAAAALSGYLIAATLALPIMGCGHKPTSPHASHPTGAVIDTLALIRHEESRTRTLQTWYDRMTPHVTGEPGQRHLDRAGFVAAIREDHPDVAAFVTDGGPQTSDGQVVSQLIASLEAGNGIVARSVDAITGKPAATVDGIYRVTNWGGKGALFTNPEAQRLIDMVYIGAAVGVIASYLAGPFGPLAGIVAGAIGLAGATMQYYNNRYGGFFIYCTWIGQVYITRP